MPSASRARRGILDTSVVIDLSRISGDSLPEEFSISALTLAELAAGPHATRDANERALRQARLQFIESTTSAIPFGPNAARAYARVTAAVQGSGRKPRGARAVDLMIAATALAEGMPLFTRNPKDFAGLEELIEVVAV